MGKIILGQKVWTKQRLYRSGDNSELEEGAVSKVGKKYFEIDSHPGSRFYIDGLKHDGKGYSPRYTVYLDKQAYENKVEENRLTDLIRKRIGQYGETKLPLEKLSKIWELLQNED